MAVHALPVDDNAVSDLKEQFRGTLLHPNDDGYDEARTIWNAMIDREPALIAQCAGVTDVIASVNFLSQEGDERVKAAYGANYKRLVTLKNKYDPENLFQMNQNIEPSV